MAYEQKDNSGSVFRNERKEKDTHPDVRGSCLIDGVDYWMDGWSKKTKDGKPWTSYSFKRKDAKENAKPAPAKGGSPSTFDDDEMVPF